MNWQDKGYLLSKNKYSENNSIAEFYTKEHGKVTGVIYGSTSKKIKNYLLIGNKFHLNFSSKNDSKMLKHMLQNMFQKWLKNVSTHVSEK